MALKEEEKMLNRKKEVYQVACLILLIHGIFLLSGCVSWEPMALDEDINKLDISKESVALLTLKISNQNKKDYQPDLERVELRSTEDMKYYAFQEMEYCNIVENEFNEYIISLQLPPGEYEFIQFYGSSRKLLIHGQFYCKFTEKFKLEQNKIVYLGHIDTIIRKKKNEDEISAGFLLPLIDQAVTGFSDGTFEVNIHDNYENDIKMIKQKYPCIENYKIEKMVLSK